MPRTGAKSRSRKLNRLEPADVLQTRMEYYDKLAKQEMRKGAFGSREKIDEYMKLAQDAAKELAPYRIAKAQAGEGDEEKKSYVIRMGPSFTDINEWNLYYKMVAEKRENEAHRDGFENANERMIERFFTGQMPADEKAKLN